jgi:hypothetical protein
VRRAPASVATAVGGGAAILGGGGPGADRAAEAGGIQVQGGRGAGEVPPAAELGRAAARFRQRATAAPVASRQSDGADGCAAFKASEGQPAAVRGDVRANAESAGAGRALSDIDPEQGGEAGPAGASRGAGPPRPRQPRAARSSA